MKRLVLVLIGAWLAAQNSPSWGRARIDSARSIIPKFIVSPVAQPGTRLPYFAVLHITGLEPNTWYRYIPRMDNSTTPPTSTNPNMAGAGNPIFYNSQSASYRFTTSASFSTPGGYDTVLSDANGEVTLIFGIQPTSNQRFATNGGNKAYIKVLFRSHFAAIVDSAYVIGDKTPIQPLALRSTCPNPDTCGSFIYDSSVAVPGTLVFLYEDYGARNLGERPLAGAVVEDVGVNWGASQLSAYDNLVDGQDKRYGTLLPHNSTGVRAIHYVSPQQPHLHCEDAVYDTDGIWPSGISTIAPANGTAPLGPLNSVVYPLLPDPGNTCVSITSTDINPSTGKVHIGYTLSPTYGFIYEANVRLLGTPNLIECVQSVPPLDLPPSLLVADSTSPGGPVVSGLCEPDRFGSQIDSLPGDIWPNGTSGGSGPSCEPCNWYSDVLGILYWRCMREEAGYAVQNFTYQGDETSTIPHSFYQSVQAVLETRRVPDKVIWLMPPPPTVEVGDPFGPYFATLQDSLTPASWGAPGEPDFTSCTFSSNVFCHVIDGNGNRVLSSPVGITLSPGSMPLLVIAGGNWPSVPGTYTLLIDPVPFPTCPCSGMMLSGWDASDPIVVEVTTQTSLPIGVRAEPTHWTLLLPLDGGKVSLYDSQGRLISQQEARGREVQIMREGLPTGLYTVVWSNSSSTATRKLLHIPR
ncbi:MAG: T9SS type A sorting domain-containing protein [Bacteroidia bacterium]|nr:T9SS type A sorting domain-containing protein [Bacteroidia bacterium]